MIGEAQIRALHLALETVTPLYGDCGLRCGAACCAPDEDGQGGVHLFPGEEALYRGADWARIAPSGWIAEGRDVPMLVCGGTCPRLLRPLGCRIFPLAPRYKAGRVGIMMDYRARVMCPLARFGVSALAPEFTGAVQAVLEALDAAGEGGFLMEWEALSRRYRFSL